MNHPAASAAATRCPVEVDLADPDTFTSGMPYRAFVTIREEAPVCWHTQEGAPGGGFWAVTKHADVREVSRAPDVFSSAERGSILSGAEQPETDDELAMMRMLLLNMDPPAHSRVRRSVARAFTPRTIQSLEPRLRELAEGIVERAATKGEGDFVADVAAELPLLAICELMGIPTGDRAKIFELSNRLIGFDDPEFQTSAEDGQTAAAEMYLYANGLAEQRQREGLGDPKDDIVTRLLTAEGGGEALSTAEFDSFFLLLAVAGNETTRNAITHGMTAFFSHPEQWERFKAGRPATAADEIIRWASPVMQFQRTATRDYTLGGQQIRAGERIGLFYTPANRDPEMFPEPDRFDITRSPNEHVAFGGGGPHFCLGANLARAEVRIIFETIGEKLPDIAPAGTMRRLRSMFVHGIKTLPVRYRP
jgi:cholest-4-en-3-one 26-monooxygenase